MSKDRQGSQSGGQTATIEKKQVSKPPKYAVILLNDDFTPMDFVVNVLIRFFKKTEQEANFLMLQIHTKGKAVCGVYSKELAETKAAQVIQFAQQNQHPLQSTIERT